MVRFYRPNFSTNCHVERGRMPESKQPCAARSAELREGVSSESKSTRMGVSRENSLERSADIGWVAVLRLGRGLVCRALAQDDTS